MNKVIFTAVFVSLMCLSQNFVCSQSHVSTNSKLPELNLGVRVSDIIFSSDGKYLAVGGFSSIQGEVVLKVWNTETWQLLYERKFPRMTLDALVFSPSSKILATVVFDLDIVEILLFDVATGKELGKYVDKTKLNPRVNNAISGVAFSPDQRTLAIGQEVTNVKRTIKLLNIEDLSNITIRSEEFFSSSAASRSLAYSPDGKFLAFATISGTSHDDGRVIVLDSASGKRLVDSQEFLWAYHVAFSPDGHTLVASGLKDVKGKSREHELLFFDTSTWSKLIKFADYPAGIAGLNYSRDGRLLATAVGEQDIFDKYKVRIMDMRLRKSVKTLNIAVDLTTMAMSPDGKLVAFGDVKGRVGLLSIGK